MKCIAYLFFALLVYSTVIGQDVPPPSDRQVQYSPYPDKTFPNRVYFGDTHLHSSFSTDAGMIGNRLSPEYAYRFARGEAVIQSHGLRAKLVRPLDFLVVSDHAENLGLAPMIAESNPDLLATEFGKRLYDLTKAGNAPEAFDTWLKAVGSGDDPIENKDLQMTMWERMIAAADKYNEPGRFTALIGYEWTSMPDGNNIHRNVIFRDGHDLVSQVTPFSQYDSIRPEDLWAWMEAYEKRTGGRVFAIPHNGNLSNGLMFNDFILLTSNPLTKAYAEKRMRWEPVYEVTQIKGDGEAHPFLSPNDEFADFENWDKGSFGPEAKTPAMLPNEYAREVYKRGLAFEKKLGANPFKFGMIGSTDAHTSLATSREDNFFGKVELLAPSADPIRMDEAITGREKNPDGKDLRQFAWETSASGLAAVWARGNTRESIWDAMSRKEVYATTGSRLVVRVFAGWDFKKNDLSRSDFAEHGYEQGVPMGGDLRHAPRGRAPGFIIRAIRDVDGANLDRVQVIKGWLDKDGQSHERIYDVAVSDGRKIDRDGRCRIPVGNTVNVREATYNNNIGAPYLAAYWKDPAFDPRQRAFYYVRAIEIPKPRWTTYDAKIFGVNIPKGAPTSIQDRAYTSPIWYTPK